MTRQPKTFYRYRGFSTKTLDSLCHDRLYLANPGTFNDPFDCNPTVKRDSSLDELRNLLTVLIRRRVRSEILESLKQARIKGEGATAHAEKRAFSEARNMLANIAHNATNPEYLVSEAEAEGWLLVSEIERELRWHYERGVCCFSTTYTNLLLWSHYGDQHQGICIGYGLDRRPRPQLHSVVYGNKISVHTSTLIGALVDDDPEAKEKLDCAVLLRKAPEWRYEKEWRLIGTQGDQESPLLLTEITFGLRCPVSVVHTVIQALSGRNMSPRYYEMYEKKGHFRLCRRDVDLDQLGAYMPYTAQSEQEMFGDPEEAARSADM